MSSFNFRLTRVVVVVVDFFENEEETLLAVNTDAAVVLVTGGCGYVGTHTLVQLLERNIQVVVVDNLVTLEPIQSAGILFFFSVQKNMSRKRRISDTSGILNCVHVIL